MRKILLDFFLGNTVLFSFFFILIYSFAAAKFGFPNKIYYPILVIISIIMGVYLGEAMYILILIITGFAIFKAVARVFA